MWSPVNWHLLTFLDSLPATSLHIDALCLSYATSFVVSITSHYYFMIPCILCTVFLSFKEFPHPIPLLKLFYVVNYFSTFLSLPKYHSFFEASPTLFLYPPPLQCYFISQLYFNYCSCITLCY